MPDEACPSGDMLAEFVERELSEAQRATVESHLERCRDCATAVEYAVEAFADIQPQREGAALPTPGTRLGRYDVLEWVGAGSMGAVFSAFDPELRRRIAIKVLPPPVPSESTAATGSHSAEYRGQNARLTAEAQALAKLSHPNVVAVHDVGTWQGRVFVAMEFVNGTTLTDWLGETPRTWREIRSVFAAAGAGLAAAHHEGLVHRDFKPDNVLIGTDGRVRVTDFGLARHTPGPTSSAMHVLDSGVGAPSPGDELRLTTTGASVGTPAYMAPEQHRGEPATAASDQFSFCVALHEAIHGQRPFSGSSIAALAHNVLDGNIDESTRGLRIPNATRRAIRRGLSVQPEDRFESLEALLTIVERRPAVRFWTATVAALGVAGIVVGLGGLSPKAAPKSALCSSDPGMSAIWNEDKRATVLAAFSQTELAYAEEAGQRFAADVRAYADRWEDIRARSCASEDFAGSVSVTALRERCLVRHRSALQALLDAYAAPDAKMIAGAARSVSALPGLTRCDESDRLLDDLPPPVPAGVQADVEAIRDELARVSGMVAGGRYAEALAIVRELDEEAIRTEHVPVRAETRFRLGAVLQRSGDARGANEALEEAALLATEGRHRSIAAHALTMQTFVLSVLTRFDEAERVARRAEAEAVAAGIGDELRPALFSNRAVIASDRGDLEQASALARKGLAAADRDADPVEWAEIAFNLAGFEGAQGRIDEALAATNDYIDTITATYGAMHPSLADAYLNLSLGYRVVRRLDLAAASAHKCLEIAERSFAPSQRERTDCLGELGSMAMHRSDFDEAQRYYRQALEGELARGDAIEAANTRVTLAIVAVRRGDIEEGEQLAREALAGIDGGVPSHHRVLANAHYTLAEAASGRGDPVAVREHTDRVFELRGLGGSTDVAATDEWTITRGLFLARAGAVGEGLELVEGLLAEQVPSKDSLQRLEARFELAKLLIALPDRRADALAYGRQALSGYEGKLPDEDLAEVRDWLAEHDS